jgi:FAD/FMN-containing dehydrogenase
VTPSLTPTDIATLRSRLDGDLFEPGSDGYQDTCTLFNAAIERAPRFVVRSASVEDVSRAIAYARENDLPLSVRAGGHSAAGWSLCDDGIVLDMRSFDGIAVDHAAGTVTVGGGCLTGAVDRALGEHGLATVTGRVSTTGMAGFTLGGGSGTLERRFGFAVDNLVAVELVTADGALRRADRQTNSDLFWALCGGGGNFGVVTSLTYRTYAVGPTITGGVLLYHAADGPAVLRNFRDVLESAPDHVAGFAAYLHGADDDSFPEALRGKPSLVVLVCHTEALEDAARELAPIRDFGDPVADFVEETTWADFQCSMDDPPGYRNYMTSEHLAELSDDAIDVVARHAADLPQGPGWIVVFPWGGAVTRPPHDTPLANRDAKWVVHPGAFWSDPADDGSVREWIRALRADLRPHASGGVWLNWVGDEGDARIRDAFGDAGYERLQAVKAAYDPGNLFRSNHNVPPRAAAPA